MEKEEKKDINKDEVKAIQRKQSKIVMIIFAILIIIIISVVGIASIVSNINEKKKQEQLAIEESNKVSVPNVVDMTYKEAKEEIEKLELQIDIVEGNLEDDSVVARQYPYAEEKIEKGKTVNVYLKTPVTIKSDNFYGMRFKKTISEFCEDYNKEIEKTYDQLGKDKTAIGLDKIKESNISYLTEDDTFKEYYCAFRTNWGIHLFTEKDSEYIVYACVVFKRDNSNLRTYAVTQVYPAIGMALANKSQKYMVDTIGEMNEENKYTYFNDNICYAYREDSSINSLYVYAISKEKYDTLINGDTSNNQTSDNSAIKTDIQDRIDFFNSYYAWNFHPTDEQMQQMVEFANSTSNFTNDTLADFIIDKGWLPDSGTGTVSSNNSNSNNNNNGNSSSSNKNTSSNSNTSQKEKPQPVVNVTVDPYSYLSKEEQNRIYENNETKKFNIVIKFNGKTIKSDTITYTGDNYVAPTYENLKVDSESGTLTVEVNGETIKYTDGAKSVSVSMYLMSDEWTANTFDFYDITKMMG